MLGSEIVLIGLSFQDLGLTKAMTIFHLFPLIRVVMAILVLKEHLNATTLAWLLLGLISLIIAVAPGTDLNYIGVCCALGAAFCYAAHIVMTRYADAGDSPMTSIFYVSIVGIIIPVLFFGDTFTPIARDHIWMFVTLCAFSIVAQGNVIMTLSYANAPLLQPLNNLQII